jgi:hypothetical protein
MIYKIARTIGAINGCAVGVVVSWILLRALGWGQDYTEGVILGLAAAILFEAINRIWRK